MWQDTVYIMYRTPASREAIYETPSLLEARFEAPLLRGSIVVSALGPLP